MTVTSTTVLCEPEKPKPDFLEQCRNRFRIPNEEGRMFVSEVICTALLMFIGFNGGAQYNLDGHTESKDFVAIALSWGLGLTLTVYMGLHVSGAHMNPAVTFYFVTQRRFPIKRFFIYVVAQCIGAFLGAALTYINYYDAIHDFDKNNKANDSLGAAKIFATYPSAHLSVGGALLDQILCTALLCLGVSVIIDPRTRIPVPAQPPLFGVLLTVINLAFIHNAGCAMNPARDFMPRLFTYMVGYGHIVFSYNNYKWFWIPIVGPMIGAVVGAWTYSFTIGFQLPDPPGTVPEELAGSTKSDYDPSCKV